MMKMATGDGIPLRQGAGTGSRLVFGGYRGLRRWNSRSRFLSGSLGIYKRCWRREQVRGVPEAGTGAGGAQGGGRAPLPRGFLVASLTSTPSLLDCFRSKNNSPEGFILFDILFL